MTDIHWAILIVVIAALWCGSGVYKKYLDTQLDIRRAELAADSSRRHNETLLEIQRQNGERNQMILDMMKKRIEGHVPPAHDN